MNSISDSVLNLIHLIIFIATLNKYVYPTQTYFQTQQLLFFKPKLTRTIL